MLGVCPLAFLNFAFFLLNCLLPGLHASSRFPILLLDSARRLSGSTHFAKACRIFFKAGADFMSTNIVEEGIIESKLIFENQEDVAKRDRLITKGRSVLDLCIKQNKLLCVQGFVDSQIEQGGVYLDVVRAMEEYITHELDSLSDYSRKEREMLRDLHQYVGEKLPRVQEESELVPG